MPASKALSKKKELQNSSLSNEIVEAFEILNAKDITSYFGYNCCYNVQIAPFLFLATKIKN